MNAVTTNAPSSYDHGAGGFLDFGGGNLVFVIDEDEARAKSIGVVDYGEGGDDDQVAGFGEEGGGAVGANDAGTLGAQHGIGPEASAAGHVPDVNFLERDDVGGLQEVAVEGQAPFVVHVGMSD